MYDTSKSNEAPDASAQSSSFMSFALSSEQPILGIGLTIPSIPLSQIAGACRPGFVFIDMEHSPISPEIATQLVHAVIASSRGACYPLIRVPSQGVEWIKWALDSGCAGIIIPMVNSKAEMETIMKHAIYPPKGSRSFGPSRAPWGLPEGPWDGAMGYFTRARKGEIAILPTIESREGLENAEQIMGVDGVSGVFIGPMDLRLSMGLTLGQDGDEPEFVAALEKVCEMGKRMEKIVGTMAMGGDVAQKRQRQGMKFLVASVDTGVLSTGFKTDLVNITGALSKL